MLLQMTLFHFLWLSNLGCFHGLAKVNSAAVNQWRSGKESACQCMRHKRHEFDPWVGKIPWRRIWLPILAFLPGKFHGQRSLVGYSPWDHKESDTTQQLSTHTCCNEHWGACVLSEDIFLQIYTKGVRLQGHMVALFSGFKELSHCSP